jgi:hypothetical protein
MVFPSSRPTNLFEYGKSATTHAYMTGNGTSSPTYNSTRSGLSVMLEAMSQGALRISQPLTQVSGWTGQTTAYLLANFNANVAPYFSTFDWLLMWASANNDYAVSSLTPAQSLANIKAIQALCAAAGKVLLLGTPFIPRTGGNAYTTQSGEYAAWGNDIIGTWARKTPGVIYFDFWDDIADPTSTTGIPGTNMGDTDGLHPASLAVITIAKRCLATLGSLVPPAPIITNGTLDFYDATNNPGGNLLSQLGTGATQFQGTAGGIGTGTTGALPSYWAAARSAGSDTLTLAKIPATAGQGYGALGGDQFTASATPTGADTWAVQSIPSCPAALVGQQVEALVTMTLGANVAALSNIWLSIFPNYGLSGAALWGEQVDSLAQTYWLPNTTYLMRTPPAVVPTGTTLFQMAITINTVAGAAFTATFGRPILRQVLQ